MTTVRKEAVVLPAECKGQLEEWEWCVAPGDRVLCGDVVAVAKTATTQQNITSPIEGHVKSLLPIPIGDEVEGGLPVAIVQGCPHHQLYNGLCVMCGKDLSMEPYHPSSESSSMINLVPSAPSLRASLEEARRIDSDIVARLRRDRKLYLVLDLDHTLLNATVDERAVQVYEEQRKARMGRPAIREDTIVELPLSNQMKHYIKLRPGVFDFLNALHGYFHLHIYTMGTPPYAEAVASVLDPEKKLFQERIVARRLLARCPEPRCPCVKFVQDSHHPGCQCGHTHERKDLKEIEYIPCNDFSMVLIVDDRDDVWRKHPANLIRVEPYRMFECLQNARAPPGKEQGQGQGQGQESPAPSNANDESIAAPEDRNGTAEGNTGSRGLQLRALQDRQLYKLIPILCAIHSQFYGETTGKEHNVQPILAAMRQRVLHGVHLLFSGVFPENSDPRRSDAWRLAEQFGAMCHSVFDETITHLAGLRLGTSKVNQALNTPGVVVVHVSWVYHSCTQWERLDESDYPLSPLPSISTVQSLEPKLAPLVMEYKSELQALNRRMCDARTTLRTISTTRRSEEPCTCRRFAAEITTTTTTTTTTTVCDEENDRTRKRWKPDSNDESDVSCTSPHSLDSSEIDDMAEFLEQELVKRMNQ